MRARRSLVRLHALRLLEEEVREAELSRQRRRRQECVEALEACELERKQALRRLQEAMMNDDGCEAIYAEMVLDLGPMERASLQQRLAECEAITESAVSAWGESRVRRLQMETLLLAEQAADRREQLLREQKMLDGWFLASRMRSEQAERFPRNMPGGAAQSGMTCASQSGE